MYIYSFHSPSHTPLFDWFFKPSIPEGFQLNAQYTQNQDCRSGEFRRPGWGDVQVEKVKVWTQALQAHDGEVIVCSDVDTQFFDFTPQTAITVLGDCDLAFQWNGGKHLKEPVCSGFFIARCNSKTRSFFNYMRDFMVNNQGWKDDQTTLNEMLLGDDKNIAPGHKGTVNNSNICNAPLHWHTLHHKQYWLPGYMYQSLEELNIPKQMVFHHANWTMGIENKIRQLEYVRDLMKQRKQVHISA